MTVEIMQQWTHLRDEEADADLAFTLVADAESMPSLSVERGNPVSVLGPSGSEKSSLLAITGTLVEPTGGEVLIGGKSLVSMSYNDQARLHSRADASKVRSQWRSHFAITCTDPRWVTWPS